MKHRFLAVLAAVSIAIAGSTLWAKDGCPMKGGPSGGPYHSFGMSSPEHLEFLQQRLGLTDAQVEKIFKIGTEYREKYFKTRKNADGLKALRDEHRKAIEQVLTEKQREEFRKFYKARGGCPHATT